MDLGELRHRLKKRIPLTPPRPYDWSNWKPVNVPVKWEVDGFKSIKSMTVNGDAIGIKLSASEAVELKKAAHKLVKEILWREPDWKTRPKPWNRPNKVNVKGVVWNCRTGYIVWTACKMLLDAGVEVEMQPSAISGGDTFFTLQAYVWPEEPMEGLVDED